MKIRNQIYQKKEKRTKVIGILSGKRGEGNTSFLISFAAYLSGIMMNKTAVVECNLSGDFFAMKESLGIFLKDESYFTFRDIDFFPARKKSDIAAILCKGYEFVILDFGNSKESIFDEFNRADYRYILGSVEPWRYMEYEALVKNLVTTLEVWNAIHILSGNDKDIRYVLKKLKIKGVKKISLHEPFIMDKERILFFQNLLKE